MKAEIERYDGWPIRVTHKFSIGSKATLATFVHLEEYSTHSNVSENTTLDSTNKDRVIMAGVALNPVSQIVSNADVQEDHYNDKNNRLTLGMGYIL